MCALRVVFGAAGSVRHVCYARQAYQSYVGAKESKFLRPFCSSTIESANSGDGIRNPAQFFFNKEVQKHLIELNCKDISKVFQRRMDGQKLTEPDMMYLTQEELEEETRRATERAVHFLQCPPVLLPTKEIDMILSKDPELQGFDESKFIFTDITYGISSRDRLIVARDPDGTLRRASSNERHRMNQIFFPEDGCSLETPKLFEPKNLQSLLERSEFEFLLDRACVQFEPDDPEYVRVTESAYNYIDDHAGYDILRGSRHFGSLVFYLSFHGKIDNILLHCISTYRIDEAVTIIKVFYLTNPNKVKKENQHKSGTDFILDYIENFSVRQLELKKMLEAYLELNLRQSAATT